MKEVDETGNIREELMYDALQGKGRNKKKEAYHWS